MPVIASLLVPTPRSDAHLAPCSHCPHARCIPASHTVTPTPVPPHCLYLPSLYPDSAPSYLPPGLFSGSSPPPRTHPPHYPHPTTTHTHSPPPAPVVRFLYPHWTSPACCTGSHLPHHTRGFTATQFSYTRGALPHSPPFPHVCTFHLLPFTFHCLHYYIAAFTACLAIPWFVHTHPAQVGGWRNPAPPPPPQYDVW